MKINGSRLSKIAKHYNQRQENKSKETNKNKQKDQVSLSDEAQQLQNIKEQIDYSPQIRQEKVDQIKQQVKEGTYNVSGEEVAKDILNQVVDKRA
ncbi:flagellar biosynthesis anti-sigma factor FlgM [Halanaerobaculum tunisiense]